MNARPLGSRRLLALACAVVVGAAGLGVWGGVRGGRVDADRSAGRFGSETTTSGIRPRLTVDSHGDAVDETHAELEPPEETESVGDEVRWGEEVTVVVLTRDDASPVEGAAVRVLVSWRPEEFRAGTTDASGRVRLPVPERGAVVWVRARGFVVHAEEARTTADALVQVRLARGRPLAGRVVAARDGRPLAGAEVHVWDATTDEEIDYAPERYGVLRDGGFRTDASGLFHVAGVPAEVVVAVAARASGLGLVVRRFAPGEVPDDVVLTLGEGGGIEGVVTRDEKGPEVGARVFAVHAGDSSRRSHPDAVWFGRGDTALSAFAVTDAEGRYRIAGLAAPGAYVAVALGADGSEGASEPVALPAAGSARRDVRLTTPAWLSARCFAPDGSPVEVEDCDLVNLDGSEIDDPFFSVGESHTSGTNEYALLTRPPGKWLLLVRAAAPWAPARVPVVLAPGEHETVDVTLERGATLSGSVADPAGRSVAGVVVRARASGTYRSGRSDGAGAFRIEGLPFEEVEVTAAESDGFWASSSVRTPCPSPTPLRMVLLPRPEVVGRVVGCGDVYAVIRTADAVQNVYPYVLEDGAFRLPHVPESVPFDLRMWCAEGPYVGLPFLRQSIRLDRGERLDLGVVAFPPGRTVEGSLVDEAGRPVVARIEAENRVRQQTCVADSEGRFRLGDAPPEPFTVVVRAPGRAALRTTIEGSRPTIRCPVGALVRGRLTAAAVDAPLSRLLRFASPTDPAASDELHEVRSGATGAFEIRLPAGRWAVFTLSEARLDPAERARGFLARPEARLGQVDVGASGTTEVVVALPPGPPR